MDLTCKTIREFMADRIDGLLSDSERDKIELHLQGCDGCRAYWDQLQKQDRKLSDWASSLEPELRSGLEQTLAAVRTEAGRNPVAFSHRRMGFPYQQAIAAGFLLVIGFFAGIFGTQWLSRENLRTQADTLNPNIRAELTAEILAQVRTEMEQANEQTKQQLGKEFSQKLKETADSFTQTLNRDREWLSTTLTVWEGKRNEERASLYRDMAKLAKITENEFVRTRQYINQSRTLIENDRSSDRISEDPTQGSEL